MCARLATLTMRPCGAARSAGSNSSVRRKGPEMIRPDGNLESVAGRAPTPCAAGVVDQHIRVAGRTPAPRRRRVAPNPGSPGRTRRVPTSAAGNCWRNSSAKARVRASERPATMTVAARAASACAVARPIPLVVPVTRNDRPVRSWVGIRGLLVSRLAGVTSHESLQPRQESSIQREERSGLHDDPEASPRGAELAVQPGRTPPASAYHCDEGCCRVKRQRLPTRPRGPSSFLPAKSVISRGEVRCRCRLAPQPPVKLP